MQYELQVFSGKDFSVRTIKDNDGILWFVAKDVAEALEYSRFDSNLLLNVPEVWRGTKRIRTPGGEQEMLCLSEQGLYFFLGRSDKPRALPYQMWIAGDVVPSLRTTGTYEMPKNPSIVKNQVPAMFGVQDVLGAAKILFEVVGLEGNQLALAMDKVGQKLTGFSLLKESGLQLVAPDQHQLLTPTQIGKILEEKHTGQKFTAQAVNLMLQNAGLQVKVGKNWEPTKAGCRSGAVLLDTGRTHNNGLPIRQLKWSSKVISELLPQID